MPSVDHNAGFSNRVTSCDGIHKAVFDMIARLVTELRQSPTPEDSKWGDADPRKYTFMAGGDGIRWLAVHFPPTISPWFEYCGLRGDVRQRVGMSVEERPKKGTAVVWTQVRFEETFDPDEVYELSDDLKSVHRARTRR